MTEAAVGDDGVSARAFVHEALYTLTPAHNESNLRSTDLHLVDESRSNSGSVDSDR